MRRCDRRPFSFITGPCNVCEARRSRHSPLQMGSSTMGPRAVPPRSHQRSHCSRDFDGAKATKDGRSERKSDYLPRRQASFDWQTRTIRRKRRERVARTRTGIDDVRRCKLATVVQRVQPSPGPAAIPGPKRSDVKHCSRLRRALGIVSLNGWKKQPEPRVSCEGGSRWRSRSDKRPGFR